MVKNKPTLPLIDYSPIQWILVCFFLLSYIVLSPHAPQAANKKENAIIRIAVATNFMPAAREIAPLFHQETGHHIRFSFGATGQLYSQIANGAPFDIFMAADQTRPELAVKNSFAVAESQQTYARGRLVLWIKGSDQPTTLKSLRADTIQKIALANPRTAPYGMAARQVLQKSGLWHGGQHKFVFGTNIAQTFQFIHTGNAQAGFIALSQVMGRSDIQYISVPDDLYNPILQDMVLLKRAKDNQAAKAFMAFMKSNAALAVLKKYGYLPTKKTQAPTP